MTRFNYKEIEGIMSDPVMFLNDAVDLEKHMTTPHSFFFATDRPVVDPWIPDVRSVYVHRLWDKVDFSVCRRFTKSVHVNHPDESLLLQTRDQLADSRKLYQSGGTVHTALHFAWFMGCRGAYMVGCDGLNLGYDPRLPQRHQQKAGNVFGDIRKRQDEIAAILKMPIVYIGSPHV